MTIDFHSQDIRGTYATRTADAGWGDAMRALVEPSGAVVADIGCGGGIYSRAWSSLGADRVVGLDFSARMVSDARSASKGHPTISFSQGDATTTGLPDASVDVVFERALIHHLPNVDAAFAEAERILKPGGTFIVQDRTIEDVLRPPSPGHFRGYLFEAFPKLTDIERERRPRAGMVPEALTSAGLNDIGTSSLTETRRTYDSMKELEDDLRARTGRSILHALDDAELERLIAFIGARIGNRFPLTEVDYWTIWSSKKP